MAFMVETRLHRCTQNPREITGFWVSNDTGDFVELSLVNKSTDTPLYYASIPPWSLTSYGFGINEFLVESTDGDIEIRTRSI